MPSRDAYAKEENCLQLPNRRFRSHRCHAPVDVRPTSDRSDTDRQMILAGLIQFAIESIVAIVAFPF